MPEDNILNELEPQLNLMITQLYEHIINLHPSDGLSSPRDYELVTDINKKTAIMDHLQDAMRVINPNYEIREK